MVVEILIFQIGVTLFIAMLFGAVFAKYKQSSIIGYLLGGILLGPHVLGFVTESQVLTLFSELGVLLLLFFIGLEVDVKKFKEGGLIAFVLGPAKMIICFSLGYFVGLFFGFSNIESMLLGLVVFVSSAAIVSTYMFDNKLTKYLESHLVLPILLIGDFSAVIILALLSTYGAQGSLNTIVLNSIFFIIVTIFVISKFSGYLIKLMEKFEYGKHIALYALGMALSLAYLANFFRLDAAIGAFLGGFLVCELRHANKIRRELMAFKDFFAAFFFVGIGLHLTPLQPSLLVMGFVLLLVYLIGHFFSYSFFGTLLGFKGRISTRLGGLMLPIGEFSLLIAGAGIVMGLPHADDILNLAIFLCITTTFIMPYFFRHSFQVSNIFKTFVPGFLVPKFAFISSKTQGMFGIFLRNPRVQNRILAHFRKIGLALFAVLGIAYLISYTMLEVGIQIIPGVPNFIFLFIFGLVLSLPSFISMVREIQGMMDTLVEVSSKDIFPKYTENQIKRVKQGISEIFASFFLLVVSSISFVFGVVVSNLFYVIGIGSAFLGILAIVMGYQRIHIERRYTIGRIETKKLLKGGRIKAKTSQPSRLRKKRKR